MKKSPLPKFKNPPVFETVLGVQFAPLREFAVAHFGLFWNEIRRDYPKQQMKAPLASVIEDLSEPLVSQRIGIQLTAEPEARCWFLNAAETELIQIQRDRFVRNWRKVTGSEDYPGYEVLKPRFERDWRRLLDFLSRERLGRPQVNQCEVTYINHMAVDVENLGALHRFARGVLDLRGDFLPEPETAQLQARYVMADKKGRLHVTVQPGIRVDDRRAVLQLSLTARGTPTSSSPEDVLAWLDLGHEWVVRGFTDFTRSEMHETWGRLE